jgi:O-antigen ligase
MMALRAQARPRSAGWSLPVFAAGAAVLVGGLAAASPILAVAGLIALVAVPAAVIRPTLVMYLLVATVFTQAITVGGITVSRLVAPIGLIALVSGVALHPTRLQEGRLTLAFVGGYVLLAVASLGWSVDASATVGSLGALLISVVFMAVFAVLIRDRGDLTGLLWAIAAASIGLACFWLVQYARGVDRVDNLAGDPNFVAAFLVLALPIVVALASATRQVGRRAALLVGVAVLAAGTVATLSRGGLMALFLAIPLLLVFPVKTLRSSPMQKAAVVLSIAIGLTVILPTAGPQLLARFRQPTTNQSVVGARADLWRAALHASADHPATGLGYGGFAAQSFQLLRTTPGVNLLSHLRFRDEGEPVHNAYLETLAELGPLGLILFLGILFATARALVRTARRARAAKDRFVRSVANALLIALIGFSASSVLLSTENSRGLWLIVGVSLTLPGMIRPHVQTGERLLMETTKRASHGRR